MLFHDAKLSVSMALPQNSNFYLIWPELQEQASIPEQQPAAWILRSGLFYCEAVWILCQPHGFTVEESRCWTGLPTAQRFLQHLEHHETQNVTTMSRDCRAARILHHTGTGQHLLIKVQQLLSSATAVYGLMLKDHTVGNIYYLKSIIR